MPIYKASKVNFKPRIPPSPPIKNASPQPIPPRDKIMIAAKIAKPAKIPASPSKIAVIPPAVRTNKPAIPVEIVNMSKTSPLSISVNEFTSREHAPIAEIKPAHETPYFAAIIIPIRQAIISTSKYLIEIFAPQCLHLPC